jgi:plasmid stability protein
VRAGSSVTVLSEEDRMSEYSARLATRITPDARKRLRVAAAKRDQSISATLTDVLTSTLPSADGADDLRAVPEGASDDDSR